MFYNIFSHFVFMHFVCTIQYATVYITVLGVYISLLCVLFLPAWLRSLLFYGHAAWLSCGSMHRGYCFISVFMLVGFWHADFTRSRTCGSFKCVRLLLKQTRELSKGIPHPTSRQHRRRNRRQDSWRNVVSCGTQMQNPRNGRTLNRNTTMYS